jgi:hypothetical protein
MARKWLKRKVISTEDQRQTMDCLGVRRGNADPFRAIASFIVTSAKALIMS